MTGQRPGRGLEGRPDPCWVSGRPFSCFPQREKGEISAPFFQKSCIMILRGPMPRSINGSKEDDKREASVHCSSLLQFPGLHAPLRRDAAARRRRGGDPGGGRRFQGRHRRHCRRAGSEVPRHRAGHPPGERRPRRGGDGRAEKRHRPLLQGGGLRRLAGRGGLPQGA